MNHISDTIYVLPCLQELKQNIGIEKEQQAGYWNGTKTVPLIAGWNTSSYGTSDLFDSFWSRETDIYHNNKMTNRITKNELLTIPSFRDYGFTSECKKYTCSKKWEMYAKFLASEFQDSTASRNLAFFVTHHNRMRNSDKVQGIIPLKPKNEQECNAYANTFTLKITVTPFVSDVHTPISIFDEEGWSIGTGNTVIQDKTIANTVEQKADINFEVIFSGFPDKGDFTDSCNSNEVECNKKFGGKGNYEYCCNALLNSIDTEQMKQGILQGISANTKPYTIYVVRHGNALHNQPIMRKMALDSSLTPLGIYQAKSVGEKIEEIEKIKNSDSKIIICSSFLQRTQLTGLCMVKAINGSLPNDLENGYNRFMKIAFLRYNKLYPMIDDNTLNLTVFMPKNDKKKWYGQETKYVIYPPITEKSQHCFVDYLNNEYRFVMTDIGFTGPNIRCVDGITLSGTLTDKQKEKGCPGQCPCPTHIGGKKGTTRKTRIINKTQKRKTHLHAKGRRTCHSKKRVR